MSYEMNDLLALMVDEGASDLHLEVGQAPTLRLGGGRIAAYETMITNTSIAQLIWENKTFRINSNIQTGGNQGMVMLDTYLMSLFNRGLITADTAISKAQEPENMRLKLEESGAEV